MPTRPISFVKRHLAESIASVRESRDPLRITQRGVVTAVLLDVESYERTRDALLILKVAARETAGAFPAEPRQNTRR